LPSSAPARSRAHWAGVPAADRRAERRALLLDAAFALLGTEGSAGTTVRAVCQRARLNPRYFYESFDDLDALLVAVYDRVVDELAGEVVSAMRAAGRDANAELRAAIDTIVRFIDDDPRRGRVLYVEALGNETLNRRRLDAGYTLVELVERNARARHGSMAKNEQIGRIGAAILVGGLSELLVARLEGRINVSRKQLVDDATHLFQTLADAAADVASSRARARRRR
jgi:AcrR family transcriptional regulator